MRHDTVERPPIGWWIAVLGGLGLNAWVGFSDAAYAAWSTHVTTVLAQTTIRNIFFAAVAVHAAEAAYAHRIAHRAGWRSANAWALQTFLLGFPSLTRLRARAATDSAR